MSSSPPSSPESSHITTVYSQGPLSQTFACGPPSQNTRSSVMNRSRPSTTPPASYRTALLHIQQCESIENQNNEATSPSSVRSPSVHSTPSSPVPLTQLEHHPSIPPSPFIPHFKLIRRFVSELMRAREYQPYIMDYHKCIIRHVKQNGEHTTIPVSFTLHDVYDELSAFAVTSVPAMLDTSPNLIVESSSLNNTFPTDVGNSHNAPHPHIAYTAIDYCQPCDDDQDMSPIIAAAMRNVRTKKFCQACMTIGHEADRCFLRGPNFRPKELTQHINIYNQQNGDKPPAGTILPIWNPRSPPAMLDGKSNQKSTKNDSSTVPSKPSRPFTNAVTKSTGKPRASINQFETKHVLT